MSSPIFGVERRVFQETLALLTPGERRRLALLIPPIVLVGLFEVAGVASLAPFLALLAQPERFMKHRILRWTYTTLEFTSLNGLFFFVGVCVLVLLTVGNALSALTTWGLLRFAWGRTTSLSGRLLRNYLYRPYPFFLERSTADLVNKALQGAHDVAVHVIWQMASLCSRLVVVLFVTATLVILDPVLALGAVVMFGGIYGSLYFASRRWAVRAGKERAAAEAERLRISMEALNGAKEIKLYRLEEPVLEAFRRASLQSSRNATNQVVIIGLPRYAFETVAFGGVLVMVLYLLGTNRSLEGTLPLLGLYAFATVRLLPALQAVFSAFNSLGFYSAAVGTLRKELAEGSTPESRDEAKPCPFERELRAHDVSFAYEGSPRPVLAGISLAIERGAWIVLIGPTGSGKSTLVDLFLGLLTPTAGSITVDGTPLTEHHVRAWQARAGYVPQQIFIVDDTIEANICFGVPKEQRDPARLERAARLAQIHEFVTHELPKGYETVVGDRGIRLSGGQRQRVGIARALYRAPSFLVLDEATSALDGETEAAFFAALRKDLVGCTVLSITHRHTTARSFDRAYRLEGGTALIEMSPNDVARVGAA